MLDKLLMSSRMMLLRLTLIGRFTAMRATLEKHPATRLGKLMRAASIAKVLLPVLPVLSVVLGKLGPRQLGPGQLGPGQLGSGQLGPGALRTPMTECIAF